MTIHEKLDYIIANAGTGGGSVPSTIVFTIQLSGSVRTNKNETYADAALSGIVTFTLDIVNKTITVAPNSNYTLGATATEMNGGSSRSASGTPTITAKVVS